MKGRQDYESHRPGFAGDAAKQAAKAYRNGTSAATFPAFSQSRPTRVSQWGRSVPARQESTNPVSAMARRHQNRCSGHVGFESACQGGDRCGQWRLEGPASGIRPRCPQGH